MRNRAEQYRFLCANQPTELVQTSVRRMLASSVDAPTSTTDFMRYSAAAITNSARDLMRRNQTRGGHESSAARMRDYCTQFSSVAYQGELDAEVIEKAIQNTLHGHPHLRDVLELTIYRNFTYKQVAEELGLSASAVRSRMERLIKLVRQRLAEELL